MKSLGNYQILWTFWGITKFGEKSCVDNVTKFGETKCCDIIFTKFGEILIKFTKLGENSVVCWFVENYGESPNVVKNPVLIIKKRLVRYKKIFSFFHQIWWFLGGLQFVISLVKIFSPNMVKTGVIHFNCWQQFHEILWTFLSVNFVNLLVKIFSQNMVKMRGIH